jgi:hypothetical protein
MWELVDQKERVVSAQLGQKPQGGRTAYDLEQSWTSARASTVNEVSLYLATESEEFTSAFLKFWNDRLERQIIALTSTEKSFFIWKLIESVMTRVRTIAAAAPSEHSRTLH